MIEPGTTFSPVLRVRLDEIVVTQHEQRYPERILHYWRLLVDPANREKDVGPPVILAPYGDGVTLLDGHHRYYASIMARREDILAIIQYPPGYAATHPVPGRNGEAITCTLVAALP